jgi:magnesium-transporting ATPase (P-type)
MKQVRLLTEQLTLGDIVEIKRGDIIPADIR